jgi:hypothetical protein
MVGVEVLDGRVALATCHHKAGSASDGGDLE